MTPTPDRTATGQPYPVRLPCLPASPPRDAGRPLPVATLPGEGTSRLPGAVVPGNKAAASGIQAPAGSYGEGGRPAGGQGTPGHAAGENARPGVPEPRTWAIELPAGMKLLSMNGRLHWAEQRRRAATIRDAAIVLARQQRIPHLGRASITVEYQPPDRRRRDHDNVPAQSGKHAIDGLVQAGIFEDDCPPHVAGISCRIGAIHPGGRLVLHITEVGW